MLSGLSHLHEMGICHRDLKPENVLCDPNAFTAKLCDLGSAKPLPKHNQAIDFIKTSKQGKKKLVILPEFDRKGSVFYISTRHYRAPELILGNKYYGTEVDLWAMGCVIAELFAHVHDLKDAANKIHPTKRYLLFCARDNPDLLSKIFHTLGVPTEEELKIMNP